MNAQPDSEYDVFCFLFFVFLFSGESLESGILRVKKKKSEKEDSV